jgi:hypothetical protein
MVYSVKFGTRDTLVYRIWDAADSITNSQLNLHRSNRAVHNRAAMRVAAGGGVLKEIN